MAGEILDSNPIINLDAQPILIPTAGEGIGGEDRLLTDVVLPTVAVNEWSTYRLARFPVEAKIKHVWAYLKGIDSNAGATATFDFNVAFSDSTTDGTPPIYQGTIPSNKNDGTSFAFVTQTGYSTSYQNSGTGNKLFGNVAGTNAGAVTYKDITFNGTVFTPAMRDMPLWNVLGFVNNAGLAQSPGGFFDIFVVVAAAVATAAAGTIAVEVDYVI